jgi:hypothetical protein
MHQILLEFNEIRSAIKIAELNAILAEIKGDLCKDTAARVGQCILSDRDMVIGN